MNLSNRLAHLAALAMLGLSLAACEEKGPMERAGEEVDEAVDSVKNGGESTATKADDAMDEVREGAKDAAEEVKN
jgi:predicted small lipoprotein YifL